MSTFIFFDVANTLLHKPDVLSNIYKILRDRGIDISKNELEIKHKLISEIIDFPPKTSETFYNHFNTNLLYSLGVLPERKLLEQIFNSCTYLPWQLFEDSLSILNFKNIGVISNWDSTLEDKMNSFFPDKPFKHIFGSQNLGVAKPSAEIYKKSIAQLKNYTQVYHVGDSLKLDVYPAEQAGITPILIDRTDIFSAYSGLKIRSLKDLENIIP